MFKPFKSRSYVPGDTRTSIQERRQALSKLASHFCAHGKITVAFDIYRRLPPHPKEGNKNRRLGL